MTDAHASTPAPAAESRRRLRARDAEVMICGGGLTGLTLAIALADAGVETLLIERADPRRFVDRGFDGRASAIAAATRDMLGAIGIWRHVGEEAQPILDIRVSDGRVGKRPSRLFLHYDHRAVGDAPLGHIVENRVLRRAQQQRLAALDRLTVLAPAEVLPESLEQTAERVSLALADGRRFSARLLVACDGRGSPLREQLGIPVTRWNYGQCGIVGTLGHERPHGGVAHEHFLPSGPFAMLPLPDDPERPAGTGHRSSIVWTERAALAENFLKLPPEAFAAEAERRFGPSLGRLEVAGPRFSWPLGAQLAARMTDRRVALVGDAAHGIHPIAGQGLNLGLRDVAALAEAVVDARRLGLDVGGKDVLARFARWRHADILAMLAATDGLNRLFSNDLGPLRLARDLGLATVDRLPGVKRVLMRHAMGQLGDLPRLLRGQPL